MTVIHTRMRDRKFRTSVSPTRTQAMTRNQQPQTALLTRSTEMNLMYEDLARAQIAARVETARRRRSVALLKRATRVKRFAR
jgi:hypothetical protein